MHTGFVGYGDVVWFGQYTEITFHIARWDIYQSRQLLVAALIRSMLPTRVLQATDNNVAILLWLLCEYFAHIIMAVL